MDIEKLYEDVNKKVEEIRSLYPATEFELSVLIFDLIGQWEALDEWMRKGGYSPEAWQLYSGSA